MRSDTAQKITAKNEKRPFSKQKRPDLVSLRGRSAAVAIFKPKAWHPVTKHGSTKQAGSPITKKGIRCVVLLPLSLFQGSVSLRATIVRSGMANRIVKDCRVGRTRPPRNDTKPVGFTKKPTGSLKSRILIKCQLCFHAAMESPYLMSSRISSPCRASVCLL